MKMDVVGLSDCRIQLPRAEMGKVTTGTYASSSELCEVFCF